MDMAAIQTLILNIYRSCNINAFPVDCEKILCELKIPLISYASLNKYKYNKCLMISSDAFTLNGTIYYNNKTVTPARIRFSLMHELGHILLSHQGDSDENEDAADQFAGSILAPNVMIHHYNCRDADQLHAVFGLSYAAANRALANYKRWYFNLTQTTRKPADTELAIQKHFLPSTANQIKSSESHDEIAAFRKKTSERIKFFNDWNAAHNKEQMFLKAEAQFLREDP